MSVGTDKLDYVINNSRIIMGDPYTVRTKDHQNRELPENKHHFFLGIAVPKGPEIDQFLGQVQQHVLAAYAQHPNVLQQINMGLNGNFAFKIDDGDDTVKVKNDNARGCYLIKISTTLPINCCTFDHQPLAPSEIKRGFMVDVGLSIKANGATDGTAGIYMNPTTIRLRNNDQNLIINSGPTPDQIFGNALNAPDGGTGGGMGGNMQGNQGGGMGGNMQGNQGGGMGGNMQGNQGGGMGGNMQGNQGGNMQGGGMGGNQGGGMGGNMQGNQGGGMGGNMQGNQGGGMGGNMQGNQGGGMGGNMQGNQGGGMGGNMQGNQGGGMGGNMQGPNDAATNQNNNGGYAQGGGMGNAGYMGSTASHSNVTPHHGILGNNG